MQRIPIFRQGNWMKRTSTSAFGVSKREGHDATAFYNRQLYQQNGAPLPAPEAEAAVGALPIDGWADRIYCQSSAAMTPIPDNTVGLAFTSPPYNVGKDYDDDLSFEAYLTLIEEVAREVYRVLKPGGRYVVNIANLGRKPYIPLHAYFYQRHGAVGFLPMGEIIWQKAKGASGNCAWGSWQSAKSPRLRDIHEYLLVFAKQSFSRPDRGESDIDRDEFMAGTLSIWEIPPESAKRVGHPAPFPVFPTSAMWCSTHLPVRGRPVWRRRSMAGATPALTSTRPIVRWRKRACVRRVREMRPKAVRCWPKPPPHSFRSGRRRV
jgi:site-specific DNA-methyltransferase (adenine-specific)